MLSRSFKGTAAFRIRADDLRQIVRRRLTNREHERRLRGPFQPRKAFAAGPGARFIREVFDAVNVEEKKRRGVQQPDTGKPEADAWKTSHRRNGRATVGVYGGGMRTTPRDYLFVDHHLPYAVDRFVEKHPGEGTMRIGLPPDVHATYRKKFRDLIPLQPGPFYVEHYGDPHVGMFEPGTILADSSIPLHSRKHTYFFRIVQQTEWDEGFLPHHEIVGWSVEVPPKEFEGWCGDGRGIELREHRCVSRPRYRPPTIEFVFEAPGSREEFLMRWRAPQT